MPGVNSKALMGLAENNQALTFALRMTGLSLESVSLFSIGLGPWMSTLIFWRVLSITKFLRLDSLTSGQSYRLKIFLAMGLGIVQALGLIAQMGSLGPATTLLRWQLVFFMVTGLMVIIWLANMNQMYGVGGQTIIILINMLRQMPKQVGEQLSYIPKTPQYYVLIGLGFLAATFLMFLVFRFFQGERRLPLRHVMLDEKYSQQAYVPIPTNPAGGMPFMYATSMMLFPQYFLSLLGGSGSKYAIVRHLYVQLNLNHFGGVLLLIGTVLVLTYGFSYVNVDYKQMAENLRNSGDYFINVYPGKNTERYLFHKVTLMATVGAAFNSVLIGFPAALPLLGISGGQWGQLLPTAIFVMLLMKEASTQFQQIYHRNDYKRLVKGAALYK